MKISNILYNLKFIKINFNNIKIQILLVFLFIFFFFLGTLTINRIIRFLIILIIAIIYSRLLIYFDKYIEKFFIKNKNIIKYENIFKILLKVNLWKNPLLFIIVKLEEKIYDLLRFINSKSNNKLIWKLSYILILNFTLINPIKIIHYKFYNMLWNWRNDSIKNLLFKRIYGVILSVLIFTDIINYIYYIISGYEIIGIYIILIIIGLLCEIYWIGRLLSLNRSIISIYAIRQKITYLGIILYYWYDKLNFIYFNDDLYLDQSFKIILNYNKNFYYELLWFYHYFNGYNKILAFKEYYKYSKLESIGFVNKNFYLKAAINKPSHIFYVYLLYNFNWLVKQLDWLYYTLYIHKVIEDYDKTIHYFDISCVLDSFFIKKLELIKNFDELRIKLFLYLLWDIEDYLNEENNYNFLNSLYIEKANSISQCYYLHYKSNANNIEDFNIIYKEKNKFWDINSNYKFYEKVYNYTILYDDKTNIELSDHDKIYNKTYKSFDIIMGNIYGNGFSAYSEANEEEYRYIEDQIEIWKKEWLEESKMSLEERNNKRLEKVEEAINDLLDYNNKHRNDEGK